MMLLRTASESTPPVFIILDFTLLMIYSSDTHFILFVTGSKVFKELDTVISSKYLLKDIPKLSSSDQTSLVEVLHKVDIYFTPKHTQFLYQGMRAR